MTGHASWENLKRKAAQGQGVDKALVNLYDQGHRNGEIKALRDMARRLEHLADDALDLNYTFGLRDAAQLLREEETRLMREADDADAE